MLLFIGLRAYIATGPQSNRPCSAIIGLFSNECLYYQIFHRSLVISFTVFIISLNIILFVLTRRNLVWYDDEDFRQQLQPTQPLQLVDQRKPPCSAECVSCRWTWKAVGDQLQVALFFRDPAQITRVSLKSIKNSGVIRVWCGAVRSTDVCVVTVVAGKVAEEVAGEVGGRGGGRGGDSGEGVKQKVTRELVGRPSGVSNVSVADSLSPSLPDT